MFGKDREAKQDDGASGSSGEGSDIECETVRQEEGGRVVGGATRTRAGGSAAAAGPSGSGGRKAARKGVEARQVDPGRPHGKGER